MDQVMRFRKKVEKDDNYTRGMRALCHVRPPLDIAMLGPELVCRRWKVVSDKIMP